MKYRIHLNDQWTVDNPRTYIDHIDVSGFSVAAGVISITPSEEEKLHNHVAQCGFYAFHVSHIEVLKSIDAQKPTSTSNILLFNPVTVSDLIDKLSHLPKDAIIGIDSTGAGPYSIAESFDIPNVGVVSKPGRVPIYWLKAGLNSLEEKNFCLYKYYNKTKI